MLASRVTLKWKEDGIMARPQHALDKLPLQTFEPLSTTCLTCGKAAHIAYHTQRTVTTLEGRHRLHLAVRRCTYPECPRYHRPYRPEAEGIWALPHGEYGLDVIALVGFLRYRRHQSLAEIHHSLHKRGLTIGERTVLNLLARYEELVTIHITDRERLQSLVQKQGSLILALDGLRPDVGHEVLWVIRDCVSGEILLARPLLSERETDLVTLLKEVQDALSVPIRGVISDGQHSIRNAVATAFPEIPHQLCHFHYLREAAKPVYEADRHAKKELKKQVRGIRPIEREVEHRQRRAKILSQYLALPFSTRQEIATMLEPSLCILRRKSEQCLPNSLFQCFFCSGSCSSQNRFELRERFFKRREIR